MTIKKWHVGLVILLLVFIYLFIQLLFASAKIQSSVKKTNQFESASGPHVILITQELDNPYWKTIEQGAVDAAGKFNMNLEYIGPAHINPNEQLDYFHKAIAAKADAIMVQGTVGEEFASLMDEAMAQGIPVITVDTDAPGTRRLAYVGTDNFASGEKLGELVVKAQKGKGQVGVIIGSNTAENHKLRLQGFLSIVQHYPDIKVVDIQSSSISQILAEQQAEKMLKKNPEIQVLIGTSALDGVAIVQAAKTLKKDHIRVFGFDDLPETIFAIKQGKIEASIVQQPYRMGYDSIQMLDQFFKNQTVSTTRYTDIHILNRGNVK
ncbi:substrate-binding domain-containing protein [Mesobacillus stamsii]|uniref:Ribose transport system substrate-binding protein n=1 Tax=Mesobacillus stamsii TaxID=225347 RepID=A0ABU0FVX8_9BACI|nr:substrate-binding domain-containing protein [Mesobacillus stamsii]MDQ0414064.1 ribose transport system substrate-binding protein [Mesobacillus stamsii]